jgi:hypothetical protein
MAHRFAVPPDRPSSDIKPENLLLSRVLTVLGEEKVVKIADLGLVKQHCDTSVMKTYVGTPTYLAPEVSAVAQGGFSVSVLVRENLMVRRCRNENELRFHCRQLVCGLCDLSHAVRGAATSGTCTLREDLVF